MTKRNYLVFPFLICLLILASCNPVNFKPLFKSKNDSVVDTLQSIKVVNRDPSGANTYKIQVGDLLDIHNTTYEKISEGGGGGGGGNSGGGGNGNNSGGGSASGFRVEEDGAVLLPKIDGKTAGRVTVAGLTRKEANDKIQELYRALIADPAIDVSVVSPRVTILGAVTSPGTYFLDKEYVSLVQILGTAGGFNDRADPQTLKIIRDNGNKPNPEIVYVNLQQLSSLASSSILLYNKDVIYVEPNKKYVKYDRAQSSLGVFQTALVLFTTGLLVYTSFFK